MNSRPLPGDRPDDEMDGRTQWSNVPVGTVTLSVTVSVAATEAGGP